MDNEYYNVSSIRIMRFLYSMGFDKEGYINSKGKENWRFKNSELLQECLQFYFKVRKINY